MLSCADLRVAHYLRIVERRIGEVEAGEFSLKVPRLRGLRLRLPGKPFHATPELFLQEQGDLDFEFPEERLSLLAGETCIVPSGMPHLERWHARGAPFLNMIVMFQRDGIAIHHGYGGGCIRVGPLDRFTLPGHLKIVEHADEISGRLDGGMTPREPVTRGLYLALLGRLREGLLSRPVDSPEIHPVLRRCHALLETDFTRPDFSVEGVAAKLGCSADHLSRTFRKHSGRRLIEYVLQKRIDYARHLLKESRFNIAEVAWACGFANTSYFNRVFRSLTAMTPGAFRKKQGML